MSDIYVCMDMYDWVSDWVSELLSDWVSEFGKQLFIILGGVDWVIKWVDLLGGVFVWCVCLVSLFGEFVLFESIVKYCEVLCRVCLKYCLFGVLFSCLYCKVLWVLCD